VPSDRPRLTPLPDRTPAHVSATGATALFVVRLSVRPRWPSADPISGLADSDDACDHPISRRRCGAVARSPVSRRPRPRPSVPHRSNRPARALRANSRASRPARSVTFMVDRAPLLRVGPLQHTSAASRALAPKAAGLRTYPAAAFPHHLPPALGRDLGRRAFALAVFRLDRREPCAASLGPADSRGGSFDRR
jgi:hypothetical protein